MCIYIYMYINMYVYIHMYIYMGVSLNFCSQNGGNLYRAPYYNRNLNIGPRIDSNLGQSPYAWDLLPAIREACV